MKRVKPRTDRERRVLAWCNKVRAKLGRKPVATLACGDKFYVCECVLMRTLDAERVTYRSTTLRDGMEVKHPEYIRKFIHSFDTGRLPHLID